MTLSAPSTSVSYAMKTSVHHCSTACTNLNYTRFTLYISMLLTLHATKPSTFYIFSKWKFIKFFQVIYHVKVFFIPPLRHLSLWVKFWKSTEYNKSVSLLFYAWNSMIIKNVCMHVERCKNYAVDDTPLIILHEL